MSRAISTLLVDCSGYFTKRGLIAITLVVPLKDIIDISFRWGIQAKSDGKCSGLGIVLNKKFSQCTIIGTLHKLRLIKKYACQNYYTVIISKVVLRYVLSKDFPFNFCLRKVTDKIFLHTCN